MAWILDKADPSFLQDWIILVQQLMCGGPVELGRTDPLLSSAQVELFRILCDELAQIFLSCCMLRGVYSPTL